MAIRLRTVVSWLDIKAVLPLLVMLCVTAGHAAPFEPFTPATPTPRIALTDIDGNTRSLEEFRGRVVLINFWATWCTPCIRELPELAHLQRDLAQKPFTILTVNVGEKRNRVLRFMKSMDLSLPVLLDQNSGIFYGWGGQVLPTTLLFDHQGRVQYRAIGDPGWDFQPTHDIIDALIARAITAAN